MLVFQTPACIGRGFTLIILSGQLYHHTNSSVVSTGRTHFGGAVVQQSRPYGGREAKTVEINLFVFLSLDSSYRDYSTFL
jgi:hypothetical protein